jgi:hypothetical protein
MNAFATPVSTLHQGPVEPPGFPAPTVRPHYESFADQLLAAIASTTWRDEGKRLFIALGLGALFGGAIGLRRGGASILVHALGVPAGLVAVAGIAVPAFAIVLGLANAPVDAMTLGRATTRAAAKAGLVLGGLAPAAALYVVTVEDAITVTIVGFGGLLLAGLIGIRSFARDLKPHLAAAPVQTQRMMTAAMPAFLAFAALLAARVWWLALPLLTGAR